jgi:hypothetical protein
LGGKGVRSEKGRRRVDQAVRKYLGQMEEVFKGATKGGESSWGKECGREWGEPEGMRGGIGWMMRKRQRLRKWAGGWTKMLRQAEGKTIRRK